MIGGLKSYGYSAVTIGENDDVDRSSLKRTLNHFVSSITLEQFPFWKVCFTFAEFDFRCRKSSLQEVKGAFIIG